MKLRLEREPLTTLDLSGIQHEKRGSALSGGTLASPSEGFIAAMGGIKPTSGVPVTGETAMRISAVYACVRIIAGLGAAFPLEIYQRTDNGRRHADDHWLYGVLHDQPNPEQTSYQWRETDWMQELLFGNGYSTIQYDGAGRVKNLWPAPANRVQVYRDTEPGSSTYRQLRYSVDTDFNGTVDLPSYRMLHIPGLGFDGYVGRSRIGLFRETLGLALATEKHGASFFGNGAMPGVILTHPGAGNAMLADNIRKAYNNQHQGPENFQETAVLFDGMTIKTLDINHQDLQFLETRSFQIAEIARMFGVPMWMLNENTKDTSWGSGLEQQFLAFLTVTMLPELKRREQVMNTKLFSSADRRAGYYVEHNVEAMLRADSAARATFYQTMFGIAGYCVNDILTKENLPTIGPDGDQRFRSANLIPLDAPEPQPAPPVVAPAAPAEPMPMDTPPPEPKPAPQANEAFRPLLEAVIARTAKRAQQDKPQIGNGKVTEESWLASVREFVGAQLEPLNAAITAVGGTPATIEDVVSAALAPASGD